MSPPAAVASAPRVIQLTPGFKWVLLAIVGLTVLSLLVSLLLALRGDPNELQRTLFSTCTDVWKMGFTGVLGLIGGKAL